MIELKNPEPFVDDPITEILRNGAKKLLAEALELEIADFLSQYADLKDAQGRMRITRNSYLPVNDMYIFRLMASTVMFAWKKSSAFWLSLVQQKRKKGIACP